MRPVRFTLPATNFCGLQGRMDLPVLNALDYYCRQHDRAYEKLKQKNINPYIYYNIADEIFLQQIERISGGSAAAARAYFTAKRTIAPRDYTSISTKRDGQDWDTPESVKKSRLTDEMFDNHHITYPDPMQSNWVDGSARATSAGGDTQAPSNWVLPTHWFSWMRNRPEHFDGPWRNHSRRLFQLKTDKADQVEYYTHHILSGMTQRGLLESVPISFWDDVSGTPTRYDVNVNYANSNTVASGKTTWHWSDSSFYRIKNNSDTAIRLDAALYRSEVSASTTPLTYCIQNAEAWYNTQSPTVPFDDDPKIVLMDIPWINTPNTIYRKLNTSTKWLLAGQTTTFHIKTAFFNDPCNAQNYTATYNPGSLHIIFRIEGDLGHTGTNIACKAVDAVDCEVEQYINISKSDTLIRNATRIIGDEQPYTAMDVEQVNMFGEMKGQ